TGQGVATLAGRQGGVAPMGFSPDGRRLASASFDKTVNQGGVRLGFSPDGRGLASASIKLWDAGTGKEVATLEGHKAAIVHVAFSPDGRRLASAGADGTVKLWNGKLDAAAWEKRQAVLRQQEAHEALRSRRWFAAAFLLEKFLEGDPGNLPWLTD